VEYCQLSATRFEKKLGSLRIEACLSRRSRLSSGLSKRLSIVSAMEIYAEKGLLSLESNVLPLGVTGRGCTEVRAESGLRSYPKMACVHVSFKSCRGFLHRNVISIDDRSHSIFTRRAILNEVFLVPKSTLLMRIKCHELPASLGFWALIGGPWNRSNGGIGAKTKSERCIFSDSRRLVERSCKLQLDPWKGWPRRLYAIIGINIVVYISLKSPFPFLVFLAHAHRVTATPVEATCITSCRE
jgi:hypothetical protein